jgi:hypothetical protein
MPFIPPIIAGFNSLYARYPENIGQPPVDKWIMFEVKSGRHVVRSVIADGNNVDRTIASVGLYLTPSALTDTLAVEYEKGDLGVFVGTAVEMLAQSGQNFANMKLGQLLADRSPIQALLKSIGKGAKDVVGGVIEGVTPNFIDLGDSLGEAIKADAVKGLDSLASFLGSEGPTTSALLGQKVNPRTDVQFDAQMYREHAYSFDLVPRNINEARAIDKIINFFQFYSLPVYRANETANTAHLGSFMMGFPYEFKISFRDGNNQELNHVNKVARSVCKSVAIDHAAGRKTAFIKDNGEYYPVATKLELHFQEVKLLARDSTEIQRANGIDPNSNDFDPRR